ncbi:MAG: hypothetical protein F6J87_19650 [Spirulina sp. SIO3F2]|nr:hypothetical protein [Spirulina sp. SIO3F2]
MMNFNLNAPPSPPQIPTIGGLPPQYQSIYLSHAQNEHSEMTKKRLSGSTLKNYEKTERRVGIVAAVSRFIVDVFY